MTGITAKSDRAFSSYRWECASLGESMGGVTGLTVAPVVCPRAAGAAAKAANADIIKLNTSPTVRGPILSDAGRDGPRFRILSSGRASVGFLFSLEARRRLLSCQVSISARRKSELVVEAELPGLDEKDVSVTLNEGVLTLQGEKKSEREEKKDDYHLMERSYGSLSFRVPDTIDADKAKASFEKGVLKVTIPKRAEAVKAENAMGSYCLYAGN